MEQLLRCQVVFPEVFVGCFQFFAGCILYASRLKLVEMIDVSKGQVFLENPKWHKVILDRVMLDKAFARFVSLIVERFNKFVQISLVDFSLIAGEAFRDKHIPRIDIDGSVEIGFRGRVLLAESVGYRIFHDGFGFV